MESKLREIVSECLKNGNTEYWWSVLQGSAALLLLYKVYINSAIFTSPAGAGIIYLLHIPG